MNLTKENLGKNVTITIYGKTKEEVVAWRNFFFNWGVISINAHTLDFSGYLDEQEKEIDEQNIFSFQAKKEKIIHAFETFIGAHTDFSKAKRMGGNPLREKAKRAVRLAAEKRFDKIPTPAQYQPGFYSKR